ncbi:MAG TPA: hypothetical protein VH683_11620 [Thermoleophilaceae bacterium]|jgi:CheY-like chemotaxis protein
MTAASDWVEVIQAVPGLLWVAFAVLVVVLFRSQIAELLPNIESVDLGGVIKAKFNAALSASRERESGPVPPDAASRLERRIARHEKLIRGSSALWVDDDHSRTRPEREALTALGMMVETVATNDEAERRLAKKDGFDLVLSDQKRGEDETEGSKLAELVRHKHPGLPVILYVGRVKPELGLPPGVFGIADRPDELFHLVLDGLERQRDYPRPSGTGRDG